MFNISAAGRFVKSRGRAEGRARRPLTKKPAKGPSISEHLEGGPAFRAFKPLRSSLHAAPEAAIIPWLKARKWRNRQTR